MIYSKEKKDEKIFAGDSLYYNKQVNFRIRMGLNLHRRK